MKKSLSFALILSMIFLLTGCGQKFEPTESTIFVDKKGIVQSAVIESFEKSYYDFDELYEAVEKEVKTYCLDKNEEAVKIISLTEENKEVTLMMEFQSVDDYTAFNEVLLFAGTFEEAIDAGYMPGTLLDAEGETAEINLEEQGDLKVLITEESVCIQTSGKIKFVSDNVSVLDKKLAKALEAGKAHPAFVIYAH